MTPTPTLPAPTPLAAPSVLPDPTLPTGATASAAACCALAPDEAWSAAAPGAAVAPCCAAAGDDRDRERGDVPGWVLVTLMTAGLVVALWAIAGPALIGVFQTAITRVTGAG